MKAWKFWGACSIVLGCFALSVQATVIDDFSDYDPVAAGIYDFGEGWAIQSPIALTPITIAETGISGTLGGNRTTTYTTSAAGIGRSLDLWIGNNDYEASASINNGSTSYGTAVYSYSNFSIDLTTGTKLTLDFDPDHLTYGGKVAVISMTVGDGVNFSTLTRGTWDASYYFPGVNYNPDRFDLDFLVSDFTGSVNKQAITSISLSLESDVAGDYAIYGISTDAIPEPASLGLLGLVASGIFFTRRIFMV